MPLIHAPEGRYRIGLHRIGTRFTLERLTCVERSECHPDGRITYFNVHDHSDQSLMIIDEDDAEKLEALWQSVLKGSLPAEVIEKHLQWVFDINCRPGSA